MPCAVRCVYSSFVGIEIWKLSPLLPVLSLNKDFGISNTTELTLPSSPLVVNASVYFTIWSLSFVDGEYSVSAFAIEKSEIDVVVFDVVGSSPDTSVTLFGINVTRHAIVSIIFKNLFFIDLVLSKVTIL